jgi:hypothetical protein
MGKKLCDKDKKKKPAKGKFICESCKQFAEKKEKLCKPVKR